MRVQKKGVEPHTDSKQIAIQQRKTKSDLQRVAFVGEIFFFVYGGGNWNISSSSK